jgi:hypothetical protein
MARRETKADEVARALNEARFHECLECGRIFAPGEPTTPCEEAPHLLVAFYVDSWTPAEN